METGTFLTTLPALFALVAMTTAADPAAPDARGGEEAAFRAGAAKSNITPPLGVSLAGAMRDRKALHVHDELYARCLVLDDGKTKIAIVVCDSLAIGKDIVARAKRLIHQRTDIPADHVLIAATHSHTAPTIAPVFQSEPEQRYIPWLVSRIADGVQRAVNNLRPARIGWGAGREDRPVFNRRFFMKPGTMPPDPWGQTTDQVKMNPGRNNKNVVKPAGPIDPALSIVAIQDTEGQPVAVLANYTLHYVGGGSGSDVSADYFGMWADMVEREWAGAPAFPKPACIALLTNGCSGNINNIDIQNRTGQPYPYHQMHKVARMVADETVRVLRTIEYRDGAPLGISEATVELGVRKPAPEDVEDAKRILRDAGTDLKSLREIYARETVLLADWNDRKETSVQALRIGDVGIATFPGEAFVELGLEVKEKSPFPLTFCIELANDYAGYIPTAEAHELGGYETWRARSSFLEPNAAPVMVSKALDLLKRLHATPK